MAVPVPARPLQRRPGQRPPRPMTYRRAVRAEISMVTRPSSQRRPSGCGRFRRACPADRDERPAHRIGKIVDVLLGRDRRDGPHPARREDEAVEKQGKEQARAGCDTGRERRRAGRGAGEDLEERADSGDTSIEAVALDGGGDSRPEALPELIEPGVRFGRQLAQRREAGRGRDRTAVERAAVAYRSLSPGVVDGHHVGTAAERRQRVAAPDDLAERREVRPDAEPALRSAWSDAERDDLVEDEERAGPIREVTQEREELRPGGTDATC